MDYVFLKPIIFGVLVAAMAEAVRLEPRQWRYWAFIISMHAIIAIGGAYE